jgi:hypothetical protein
MSVNICPVRDFNPHLPAKQGRCTTALFNTLTPTGQKDAVVFGYMVTNAYRDCVQREITPDDHHPTNARFYRANIKSKNIKAIPPYHGAKRSPEVNMNTKE